MNSYLSKAGIAARRKSSLLIKQGLVTVNGEVVSEPGFIIDPGKDRIKYRNSVVKPVNKFTYILLNKPKGYVCTVSDERNRPSVLDILKMDVRLYPVGRLDLTTTGLLLLTDDGELCYRLSHPKFKIDKVYSAVLHKPLRIEDKQRLLRGISIGKGEFVKPGIKTHGENSKTVDVTIHEGKYHIIKRIFDTLGYKIISLDRTGYACLTKRKLPRSGWRYLSLSEINELYKRAGLKSGH